MITRLLYIMSILLLCLEHTVFALTLPEHHAVNGGLAMIPINTKVQPEAYFQGKKIPVLPSFTPNQWILLAAIPLNRQEPIQYISMTKPSNTTIPFVVSTKIYPAQYLIIKDTNKVTPPPEDQTRIEREKKKLAELTAHYSTANPFAEEFTAPTRGPISSYFGLKRVYNQQARDPHSGLDIAAPEGAPVHAVNQGTVVETGDYFFTGNTVLIDHGQGVFSLYAHLSEIQVKIGEFIPKGQQLGLVGKTGRVTGPHLHWTMIVNQTLVEPLLFVPLRNIVPDAAPKPPKNSNPINPEKHTT